MVLREGQVRIPSGCAISGIMNLKGERFSSDKIVASMAVMRERSNGLGGGFAAYGIYPEFWDCYALHIFYEANSSRKETEEFLESHFLTEVGEMILTRKKTFEGRPPLIWRYFVRPKVDKLNSSRLDADEYVFRCIMNLNSKFPGSYVFSSGKNMGVFKGVGYPEELAEFYRLEDYQGYLWTAHGRFPTNTPGWWGGAHPFSLLDLSVVHNGEISSYDANRRFLEMYDYRCSLQTDTEAIAYIFDLLLRRHGLPLEASLQVVAPPFWPEIAKMAPEARQRARDLRIVYGSLLLNGPFSILLAFPHGMVALNDRLKLRSLTAGKKGDFFLVASEEAALRIVFPELTECWSPGGGEPVVACLPGGHLPGGLHPATGGVMGGGERNEQSHATGV